MTPFQDSNRRQVRLRPAKVEDKTIQARYIFGNICAVSPNDFPPNRDGSDLYIRLSGGRLSDDYVVTARPTPGFRDGCIALSDPQRAWCGIGLQDDFVGELYNPFAQGGAAYVGAMEVEIGFASARKIVDTQYDQDELAALFVKEFQNQVFAPGQRLLLDVKNVPLAIVVKTVTLIDLSMMKESNEVRERRDPPARGILTSQSTLSFSKDAKSPMKLKGSATRPAANAILKPGFKFEDLGIGGLDEEFATVFRRAFASHLLPRAIVDKMGIKHVRGLLLYGPPGTGKTLIARQIGKMLNAREPKIVSGPEVFNKYVGQSEENVRKLFADAEKEYKEKGDESGLHIIIFDELDAMCKQRSSGASASTGIGDNVVNQILSKFDGVDQLNNILVIGMTNRKDLIDDALLRPGRFELQIQVGLPDQAGRTQILNIHTAGLKKHGLLGSDVDIDELAAMTKNWTGADLEGLVRAASQWAMMRHVEPGTVTKFKADLDHMKVVRDDFLKGLGDINTQFGTDSRIFQDLMPHGIIHFSSNISAILSLCMLSVESVRTQEQLRRRSVLLHGPLGSGKTALAAKIAMDSQYPFAEIITPESLVGFGDEFAKKNKLHKSFTDAYKSPLSLLIIDNIDQIIEWNPVGPRFSNGIVHLLVTFIRSPPPKGCRLLIMATTSRLSVLELLDIAPAFERVIPVPAVQDTDETEVVLAESGLFKREADVREALKYLRPSTGGSRSVGLGVKTILATAEEAQSSAQPVQTFADDIVGAIARWSPSGVMGNKD